MPVCRKALSVILPFSYFYRIELLYFPFLPALCDLLPCGRENMKSKRLVSMVALALALTGCKTTPATSSTTNHSSSSSSAEKASSSSSSKATSSTSKAMEKEDYKNKLDELIAGLGEKKGYTLTFASVNVEKIIGEEA